MTKKRFWQLSRASFLLWFVYCAAGCASIPYKGVNPERPQFERGYAIAPIDGLANLLAFPYKLLFWNWRLQNHRVSLETETDMMAFMDQHGLDDVKVYIAKFTLFPEMKRLYSRHSPVAWPYRILPGTITTLFAGLTDWLIGGDYYNPFTNSIHLYSDDSAIALHEAGHALDFKKRTYRGTYAIMRMLPAADTHQEWEATDAAITYYKNIKNIEKETDAYKILYPAYGSYVGGAVSVFIPIPYLTSVAGVLVGHVWGRIEAKNRYADFQRIKTKERRYFENLQTSPTSKRVANG